MAPPPLPDGVRVAELSDLPRLSFVTAVGFQDAPYERIKRNPERSAPRSIIARSWANLRADILDVNYIVVVAEADYDKEEGSAVKEEFKGVPAYPPTQGTGKVIVGVAMLQRDIAKKKDDFQPKGDAADAPSCPYENDNRDQLYVTGNPIVEWANGRERKWYQQRYKIWTTAVHPKYRRSGHGSKMIKWFIDYAQFKNVELFVSAEETGRDLYIALKFKQVDESEVREIEVEQVPGKEIPPIPGAKITMFIL